MSCKNNINRAQLILTRNLIWFNGTFEDKSAAVDESVGVRQVLLAVLPAAPAWPKSLFSSFNIIRNPPGSAGREAIIHPGH